MKTILYVALFGLILTSLANADDISGRYLLNTNNNYGFIDIVQQGTKISGKMTWSIGKNGQQIETVANIVDGHIEYGQERNGKKSMYISFIRGGKGQKFHGWFSYDRKFIGGYFEKGYTMPWFAIKPN